MWERWQFSLHILLLDTAGKSVCGWLVGQKLSFSVTPPSPPTLPGGQVYVAGLHRFIWLLRGLCQGNLHNDTREWEILKYLMNLSWGKHRILNLNPSPDSQLWHGLRPTKGLLRPPEGLQLWRSPAEHICIQKGSKNCRKAELSYHQKGLAARNSSEATHPASQLC